MLDSCDMIPEQNTGPQTTLTGVLFPTYFPFALLEADIDHELPPPSFPLPFHITSSKRFEITYQGRKLLFQAASADSADSIVLPNITVEDLQEIKLKLSPLSPTFFYEIISYTLACFTGLLLISLFILVALKKPTILNNIKILNQSHRIPVNLTLTKILSFMFQGDVRLSNHQRHYISYFSSLLYHTLYLVQGGSHQFILTQ